MPANKRSRLQVTQSIHVSNKTNELTVGGAGAGRMDGLRAEQMRKSVIFKYIGITRRG